MTPERKLKLQNILLIIGMGLIFGMLYNYSFYPHTYTEFLEAGVISILISLLLGFIEEFVFKKRFQKISFLYVSIIRSLLYSLLTSLVLSLVLSIEIAITEQISYFEAVVQYILSPLFKRDFIFTFIFLMLLLFILQIILLIGRANFFRLIFGLYHRPREVSKIFMFVDLKGSTAIAEKLSNKDFSSFVKDYFYDISDAIMMFNGEIYKYVGDEAIITWPIRGNNLDCIKSFFKMIEIIDSNRSYYIEKYNIIPQFKAGIHVGSVIVTSIGKQRKEIAYLGDVLNTTARIEGKCNELNQNLLISENMLHCITMDNNYIAEEKGEIELRGKAQKQSLYALRLAAS